MSPTTAVVIGISGLDRMTAGDEFERMRLVDRIERDRQLVAQYEEHQAFYRARIEDSRYKLGRLDERLGGQT